MFCPKCQNELNDDMNFCPHCGYQVKRCPYCHQLIKEGDLYCSACGRSLQTTPHDQMGGYYQPLFYDETPVQDEEKTDFKKVPVKQKVNKVVVLVSVIVSVILTVLSYEYLEHGPTLTQQSPQISLPQEDMTIAGQTVESSLIGNINQNGQAYFDGKDLYLCDSNGYLVRMNQNLDQQETILAKSCQYITIHNDKIYYTDENNYFCEMSKDGQNQKTLISKDIYYPCIDNDKLYYQLDEDDESLYVYDFQSQKQTKLNNRHSYCINIVDDMIYYSSTDGIYRIHKDGKNDEKIISGKSGNVIYSQGKLYYLSTEGLCALDIKSEKVTVVEENAAIFLNMNDQYLFYQSMDGSVVRYDLSSQEEKTIYNGLVENCYIAGDKLIIKTSSSLYQQESYSVVMDFDGLQQRRLFFNGQGEYI